MPGTLQPLDQQFAIVDGQGKPTLYFIQWAQQKQIDLETAITADQATAILVQYLLDHQIQEGSGIQISPSGNLTDLPTIAADVQEILDQITSTRGAILYRGLLGWAALAPGTAGYVLSTNGAGADPSWIAPGGGGGGMSLVASATLAVAASTLAVTGLDLDTDKRYFVRFNMKNATTTDSNLSLYYNADTTATNYNREGMSADGTTLGASRNNDAVVGAVQRTNLGTRAGDTSFWGYIWRNVSGLVIADIHSVRSGDSSIMLQRFGHQWRTTGANVTGLTISSAIANALAIGSSIEVFRI